MHDMVMTESECYSEEIPASDHLIPLICHLLRAVSGVEGWLVAVCCAVDVERLPMGAGFQRENVFLPVLILKLHWLFWWIWDREKAIFLVISHLISLVSLPSSLKLGRWQLVYDSRGYCSRMFLQHVLFLGNALLGTLWHQALCVADHCSCFTVVNNIWFRKVRDICGFHSPAWLRSFGQADVLMRTVGISKADESLLFLAALPVLTCGQWPISRRKPTSLWEKITCYVAVGHIQPSERDGSVVSCMINVIRFCWRSWQEWGR